MARPTKEGMDYFPHDTDASNDEKVEVLQLLYGNDGYAFYFKLLERIYRNPDFELDVSEAETIQILAKKCAVTLQEFEKMLQTALKNNCFDRESYENRKVLTSKGIKKRAESVINKRMKMREAYEKRQENQGVSKSEEVSGVVSDAETMEETPQSKVKKSKEKKSKEKESKEQIPFAEIIRHLNERTNSNFKSSSANTQKLIKARWNEGFRLDDFKRVIDKKTEQWLGKGIKFSNGKDAEEYLQPNTLFAGDKFERYLNEKGVVQHEENQSIDTGW